MSTVQLTKLRPQYHEKEVPGGFGKRTPEVMAIMARISSADGFFRSPSVPASSALRDIAIACRKPPPLPLPPADDAWLWWPQRLVYQLLHELKFVASKLTRGRSYTRCLVLLCL